MAVLYFLIVPVLIYIIRAFAKPNIALTKRARYSRSIFIGFILLYVFLLCIIRWNFYLIGYRSTSIVFILTALAGIVYVLADTRYVLESLKRVILNLAAVIFMSCLPVLVMELFEDYNRQLVYSDPKFRIEQDFRGPMAPRRLPGLFKKNFPIERRLLPETDTCISIDDISRVTITDMDSIYFVTYFLIDRENHDSIYQLNVKYIMPQER